MYKIDGYKMLFEEDDSKPIRFEFKNFIGRVFTFLRADGINRLQQNGYRKYWFDSIDDVLAKILFSG